MTIEGAKEFLNRGFRAKERIAAKYERIARWQRIAESITVELRPACGSSSLPSKKIETCVCNIVDLQSEIKLEIEGLIAIEREISQAIALAIADPTLRAVLELRYLNYLKWEEIAVRLNITFRWVMALHKKALKLFAAKAC